MQKSPGPFTESVNRNSVKLTRLGIESGIVAFGVFRQFRDRYYLGTDMWKVLFQANHGSLVTAAINMGGNIAQRSSLQASVKRGSMALPRRSVVPEIEWRNRS